MPLAAGHGCTERPNDLTRTGEGYRQGLAPPLPSLAGGGEGKPREPRPRAEFGCGQVGSTLMGPLQRLTRVHKKSLCQKTLNLQ